jgi:hypothetical protein
MANKPAVLSAVSSAFAAQLSLPVASGGAGVVVSASAVRVTNITDVATNSMTVVPPGRRLGGAGSAGVRFTSTVDLGPSGSQATAVAMQAALAAMPPTAPAFTTVVSAVASAANLPVASLAAAAGPPAVVANAPFTITASPAGASAASSSASSSGGVGGPVAGGIIGSIVVGLGIWTFRSYRKHGQLPCCRDRAMEKRAELERLAKISVLTSALDERSSKADALAREVAELRKKLAEGSSSEHANPITRTKFGPSGIAK